MPPPHQPFPDPPPVSGSNPGRPGMQRAGENLALAVLLAVAALFYFWTATSAGSPLTWERQHDDLYNRLADGFLAGRTSFLESPPAELAQLENPYDPAQNAPYQVYHDITYYQGRYYLYFGPTPVVLLLAPWKFVTGSSLPQNLAVVGFAWGSALLGVGLLRMLRDRYFPRMPGWLLVATATAATFGNLLPVLLRRPLHYELAIATAGFCGLAALGCSLRAQESRHRRTWLAATGTWLGLAVGARPDYLFGAAAFLLVWAYPQWRPLRREPWREQLRALWRPVAVIGLPFAGCLLGLLAYNYARFGNPGEFGTSYMLAGSNQQGVSQLGLRYIPINLYYYFAALPNLGAYFPFVYVTGFPPFAPPEGYGGQENMYGLALTLPVLWALGLLWPALKTGAPDRVWRDWARGAAALALGNLGFLLLLMGAANRYYLDFVPVLTVLAGLGLMQAEPALAGWRRWLLRAGWGAALGISVAFNLLVSLQHNELLSYHNPETYARIATVANRWADRLFPAAGKSGPLQIELTLPAERTGKLEPLLVTGMSFRADFLYVFYKDENHLQIGFEHTSYGGPLSPPVEVDYSVPHVLEVQMGALYPPVNHPYYDGKTAEAIRRLKHTLLVRLDGQTVLSGTYDFYDSSPGDVSVGRNPVSDAFGRRFTGQVRAVRRQPGVK